MNIYMGHLSLFCALFSLCCTLAYLPGVLSIPPFVKRNLLFLGSLLLLIPFPLSSTTTHYGALALLVIPLNFRAVVAVHIKGEVKRAVFDLLLAFITLFLSTTFVAAVDDLPVQKIILERFADGSFSFFPGHLEDMLAMSIGLSVAIVVNHRLYLYLIRKWSEYQALKIDRLTMQKRNVETQFDALQAKVNPHFLYNSLNSIAGLALVDGENTRQMALALSRFFRYSMNRDQQPTTTLREEAEMLQTYLEIEKIRFGNLLNYTISLPKALETIEIPRMFLQPIVENSIKHGLKGEVETLLITVDFSQQNHTLRLSVCDNGAPFAPNFAPGYGIQSVYDKLDLLLPNRYSVEVHTEPIKEFCIQISPLSHPLYTQTAR